MRIGVDGHVLTGKYQGTRTYFEQLYRAALRLNQEHDFIFFGHWAQERPFGPQYPHVEFRSTSRWRRMTYQTAPLMRRYDIDFYHCNYIAPLRLGCERLVTIHDILFESHPEFFAAAERLRNRLLVRLTARSARQIHVVSEFTKQQLMERYTVEEERIRVVPNGVDLAKFFPEKRDESVSLVKERFGVSDYLLTVGRLEPRKNHLGLLQAYGQLLRSNSDVPQLVIVGQRDFGFDDVIAAIQQKPLSGKAILIEDADGSMLPHLYRAASLFLYPSFAEGFGIPPLEAMASGLPVICSETTGMAEVVGADALLIDPKNIDQIAGAIMQLLDDSELRSSFAERGLARAKHWTWERSARKYLNAIDELDTTRSRMAPIGFRAL